jgi:hypothetical protein
LANNDKAKPDAKKGLEEVAAEQNRIPKEKAETKTKVGTSLQWPPNWVILFPKLDHLIYPGLGQRKAYRTITPEMAPAPCWCPLGLMSTQMRRILWMRVQKLREEAAEKERDEHLNTIRSVTPRSKNGG